MQTNDKKGEEAARELMDRIDDADLKDCAHIVTVIYLLKIIAKLLVRILFKLN